MAKKLDNTCGGGYMLCYAYVTAEDSYGFASSPSMHLIYGFCSVKHFEDFKAKKSETYNFTDKLPS